MIGLVTSDNSTAGVILSWVMFFLMANAFVRLTIITGRIELICWGMFLIVVCGVLFLRLPESYGLTGILELQPLLRAITYTVVIVLDFIDWCYIYRIKKMRARARGVIEERRSGRV